MSDIGALIVTFNPDINTLGKLIKTIDHDCSKLVIIDNNSNDKDFLKSLDSRIKVIFNEKNVGLAKAQNQGIKYLSKYTRSKKVIIFDQDSNPNANMIRELNKGFNTIKKDDKNIIAVGPKFIDSRTKKSFPFIRYENLTIKKIYPLATSEYTKVDFLISSGCLIDIHAFKKVGLMDENLFIDCIDTEWCMRAISKKYSIYGVQNAEMYHTIGDNIKSIRIPLLGEKNILTHSTFRKYYMYRNRILLIKNKNVFVRWKIQTLLRLFPSILIYIFFNENKLKNIKSILKGILTGLKDKNDRYETI